MTKKILYIAGYGRSGSSVLSRMLGYADGFVSVGEFWRVRGEVRDGGMCSCGSRIADCRFWSGVIPKIEVDKESSELDIMRKLLDMPSTNAVIDSTKTAYSNCITPAIYYVNGFDVRIIHLTRSFSKVLESAKKGRNRDLENGVVRRRAFETIRTLAGWLFANCAAATYGIFLPRRYLRVRYEELVGDPLSVFIKIGDFLEVDLRSVGGYFESGGSFPNGHELAGNRTLRSKRAILRKE